MGRTCSTEAEVTRGHLALLRQRHRHNSHDLMLEGRVCSPFLTYRGPKCGKKGILGWEHDFCSLVICGSGVGDDVWVLLEHVLTRAAVERHPCVLNQGGG